MNKEIYLKGKEMTADLMNLELQPLLSPNSIAIIGASKGQGYAGRLIMNLQNSEFRGELFFVNPKYDYIGNMKCYPSVEAIPKAVDLAVVILAGRLVLQVLEECSKKGVRAALVISAGFAETGREGRINQESISELFRRHGLLVCGPNCLGIANMVDQIMVHAYLEVKPWLGNIGLVSQSGALAFASILSQALDRGISFSYIISSGNEAALESIDYMNYLVKDKNTRVICCFLEGFKEARRFLEVADAALEEGKPILICKVGQSELGARQAVSHTGSMTGSDEVYQAAFDQKGVIRVLDPDDLFEVGSVFSRCAIPKGDGLAIITTSGGMGGLLADRCGIYGMSLPPLSKVISDSLLESKFLLGLSEYVNPVDIRGQGASYLPDILKLFIEDDSYHILIVALGLPAVGELSTKIAEDLIKISSDIDKPLIVLWTGSKKGDGSFSENDGFRLLEKSAVPIFYSPEKCIRAVKSLISYHKFRKKRLVELSKSTGEISADTEMLHAQSFLEGRVDSMDEFESRQLLSCYGIPTVNERLTETVDEAIDAANEIGYPVVLKVVSKELLHKTEAGAIRLPINDENSLRSAYMEIKKNVEKVYPNANVRGILIQEMITVAREFIVGVFRDDQFGPVVVCGLGGIFTELYRDVSRRIPPLTKGDVLDMLQELKCFPMLKGYRGHQAADIQALVDVILRVGKMALDFHDRIAEIDINPLMVKEEGYGVCAVDSLVVLR